MPNQYVTLSEISAHDVNLVGQKAHRLAIAKSMGHPVCDGFVITTENYKRVIARPAIAKMIVGVRARIEVQPDSENSALPDDITDLLSEIRTAIEATPFSKKDIAELEGMMGRMNLLDRPLAVRSSAVGEDGLKLSFAGIHESETGIKGINDMLASVRRVQASLWSPRAFIYRLRLPKPETVLCAVFVCGLLFDRGTDRPSASGVAFSVDPVSGDHSSMVLESVSGFGTGLVSGAETPRRVTLPLRGISGGDAIKGLNLAPDVADRLVTLIRRMDWNFGFGDRPQDIEWVIADGQVYIVQIRPATTAVFHPLANRYQNRMLWSDANIGEVFPGVLTPFSWSLLKWSTRSTMLEIYRRNFISVPAGLEVVRRFSGRAYFEMSLIQYLFWISYSIPPSETNKELGGQQPEIDIDKIVQTRGQKLVTALRRLLLGNRLMMDHLILPSRIQSGFRWCRKNRQAILSGTDKSEANKAKMLSIWNDCDARLGGFPFMHASSIGAMWMSLSANVLPKDLPEEIKRDIRLGLLAASGNITSAEHGYAMSDLKTVDEQKAFFAKFGHRGFEELELANPRWRDIPERVIEISSRLKRPDHSRDTAKTIKNNARALLADVPKWRSLALKVLSHFATRGFAIREASKSYKVALLDNIRTIAVTIGSQMAKAGQLEDKEDIFFLAEPDLKAWLTSQWDGTGAQAIVAHAKAYREKCEAQPDPAPIQINEQTVLLTMENTEEGDMMTGIAASSGMANGVAHVINTPQNIKAIQKGQILVCRATDPGWTPAFLLAGGIIAEKGGFLSHGAIVARELGLPAIVNVSSVTQKIKNGDHVTVDGSRGIITITKRKEG